MTTKTEDYNLSEAMSKCLDHNICVYPVYFTNDTKIDGHTYEGGHWFVRVENNGVKTTYKKPIGKGANLTTKKKSTNRRKKTDEPFTDWVKSIHQTWIYWAKLIDKQDGINKNN